VISGADRKKKNDPEAAFFQGFFNPILENYQHNPNQYFTKTFLFDHFPVKVIFQKDPDLSGLQKAIAHLIPDHMPDNGLTIFCLDASSSQYSLPFEPWQNPGVQGQKRIPYYKKNDLFLSRSPESNTLSFLYKKCRVAIYWVDDYSRISAYEKAAKESPESARVFFNLGAAYYQKGEYAKAIEAFKQAAVKSKDVELEANSKFNLGNSSFREAEQEKMDDLHKVLESYGKSIEYYREALELSPDFIEAAENIEMARLEMKSILDEIKKQEEASEKQNQAQQEAVDKMEQLIEKQKKLKDRAEEIKDQMTQSEDRQNSEKKIDALAEDQKKLTGETKKLADKLPSHHQDQSAKEHPSKRHLSKAANLQEMAAGKLSRDQVIKALENQEQSIDELQNALDSLKDNRKNDQQQQKKQDKKDNKNISQDDGAAQEQETAPGKEDEAKGKDKPEEIDAASIIDEERENMKNRKQRSAAGYKEVERDW